LGPSPIQFSRDLTSTSTETTAASRRPVVSFVYTQRSSAKFASIQSLDRRTRAAVVVHFNESETSGATCFAIHHHVHRGDAAMRLKKPTQIGFRGSEGEVSDIKLLRQLHFLVVSRAPMLVAPPTHLRSRLHRNLQWQVPSTQHRCDLERPYGRTGSSGTGRLDWNHEQARMNP